VLTLFYEVLPINISNINCHCDLWLYEMSRIGRSVEQQVDQ
jgi:hypothetical protein